MNTIYCETIGNKAFEVLEQTDYLTISGITSQGVFINCGQDWMIFLARERFRGPLTAIISSFDRIKDKFERGADGVIDQRRIRFPDLGLILDLNPARIWTPEPLPAVTSDIEMAAARRAEPLVARLLNGEISRDSDASPPSFGLKEVIKDVALHLRDRNLESLVSILVPLLGLGRGLTPEGDDFVLGLVYMLRVAKPPWFRSSEIEEFLTEMTNLAKLRTTRLSANLIMCAAEGLVDERISKMVSAMYFDADLLDARIEDLLSWGKTSGRMVLAGVLACLEKT